MAAYFSDVLSALLTTLFFVFLIASVGYLIGGIEVKGISLGTAGVLLMALVYGIIANEIGSFTVGEHTIVLFDTETVKPMYSLISNLGTAMFVTAVGLIAGPKFFRNFNRGAIAYILMGVVFFVQLVPKILHVNIAEERKKFVAAGAIRVNDKTRILKKIDGLDFFPFMLTVFLGLILGSIKIPGINFSLGSSGGTLVMGLIVGHFGHMGRIDLSVSKNTLNFFRELGLMLFLIGAGVPGGVSFIQYVKVSYFVFGAIMTLMPMLIGFILGKYVFKLSVFNNLGSLTGGMTSTPALGTLISVAGTDDVASAYAATYPIALVIVVLAATFLVLL